MPPEGLVRYGYLSDAEIQALRQAKIRCWYRDDLNPAEVTIGWTTEGLPIRVRKRVAWTEPVTTRIAELYQKGTHKFAGLTEIEFVIRMSPDKDNP